MNLIAPLIILISALFLLLAPLAFAFSARSTATIKTKIIVQTVATVMLALATVGVGLIWVLMLFVGGFQQLEADMKRGQAELDFPILIYYSPWYVISLWIVNLIVFLRDTDISIHAAAAKGNIEAVKKYLDDGKDVNAKDDTGMTPLHYETANDHKELAELLIAKGANVNAKSDEGRTPLHYAAIKGHKELAELLIANDADVNAKTLADDTPLDEAIRNKRTETADLLRKHGGKTGEELKAEGK